MVRHCDYHDGSHTTPFFLPPEDPFPVLLQHNSTQLWEPDPAPARRPMQQ
jgi:hypothetical protein